MDVSPLAGWDRDVWDEYDAAIDVAFHGLDIHYTPLMNFVNMPSGADTWYTGREMLAGHTNHNAIGNRQRFIEAMYVDNRVKRLVSNQRHGGKVQLHEFDELVSRWGNGSPQFMMALLRGQLGQSITETHEKLARDALFTNAQFQFLANGTRWSVGTADWSTLSGATYQVDIRQINEVRLRLTERSSAYTRNWGTFAQPVPGSQFAGDMLVLTTPNVLYDIENSDEGYWLESLHVLQDERIINGGRFRYKGMTFAENRSGILYNAGPITHQCGVTSPILWGDGSPDPDAGTQVDNIYFVGQSGADCTHYIQCDDIGTSQFEQGDRITIHTSRTSDYGVTNGCDIFDGESYEATVVSVDESTERIVIREPMTYEYTAAFTATPVSTASATIYAFVTKARAVHPIVFVGSRGMCTFAMRTKIRTHNPEDNIADLPGVIRATWDQYGQYNLWNPYPWEILYAVASDTRSGYDAVSLR
jgi:hypothetical protein